MSPKKPKIPGGTIDRLSATYQYLLRKGKDSDQSGDKRDLNREVRDALVPDYLRLEMANILFGLSQEGLCSGGISEASYQFRENQFLVTRKGCWFNDLADDDLILLLANTSQDLNSESRPQHWDWHLAVYQRNPEIKAIILGQPADVMALASKDLLPQIDILSTAAEYLQGFSLCRADTVDIGEYSQASQVLVLPGTGVLSFGSSLVEAAIKLELINKLAEITLLAK